jgi:ABC-type multidrug transport system fused ATPase/permease subunit
VFYELGLSLSFFLQHHELLSVNSQIRTEVGQTFNELLILVRDVSLYYRTRISALSSTEVSVDFHSVFGKNISTFYRRKDHIIDAMWECRLGDECSNVRVIRQWLDIRDTIIRAVIRERAATSSRRDEYTCEWIERPLLEFSRGGEKILAITGPSGCGKSILAGWIVERLQRPLGKKTHETLSITIGTFLGIIYESFSPLFTSSSSHRSRDT